MREWLSALSDLSRLNRGSTNAGEAHWSGNGRVTVGDEAGERSEGTTEHRCKQDSK